MNGFACVRVCVYRASRQNSDAFKISREEISCTDRRVDSNRPNTPVSSEIYTILPCLKLPNTDFLYNLHINNKV